MNDNQGVAPLLEHDCTVLLISDASGQISTIAKPRSGSLATLLRATTILVARVRDAQYREIDARRRAALVSGLMVVHLKRDLDRPVLDAVSSHGLPEPLVGPKALTSYGIPKGVQERLAAIRSSYDAFSDVEAYALMTSGYLTTTQHFPLVSTGTLNTKPASVWRFLNLCIEAGCCGRQ